MKKSLLILTALVVVIASISLAACSNTPLQSILELPWENPSDKPSEDIYRYSEKSTYEVVGPDEQGVLGTLTVEYKTFNDIDLDLFTSHVDGKLQYKDIKPSYVEKSFHGLIITSKLAINDGQFKDSVAVTDMQLKPKYSYEYSHFKDMKDATKYEDIEAMYDYSKVDEKKNVTMKYDIKGNVVTKNGEQKLKPFDQIAYFGNPFYIALTRTLGPATSARQLSFLTHSYREDKMLRRVAGNTGRPVKVELSANSEINLDLFEKIEDPNKKPEEDKKDDANKDEQQKDTAKPEEKPEEKPGVLCVGTSIASAETMPGSGSPILYFISATPYKVNAELKVPKVLVKFIEHGITYNLISMEITPEKK